ncbi:MAG: hypothetical protein IJO85_07505 [Lachnospiraceae bacterium]|nr:hypothetical protein [Lachnospiraceae bacterium]
MSQEKAYEILSSEEQEVIGKAIYSLVSECPAIPKSVKKSYGDINSNTVGMFAEQGAIIRERYVNGAFIAQYPFTLLYRSKPDSDKERMAREETLSNIAKWLCGKEIVLIETGYKLSEYPALTDGRKIIGIEQRQTVYPAGKLEDGSVDYQVHLIVEYRKKGMY